MAWAAMSDRVNSWVALGSVAVAFVIFIDEGRSFRHRPPHRTAEWLDWDELGVSVLLLEMIERYRALNAEKRALGGTS